MTPDFTALASNSTSNNGTHHKAPNTQVNGERAELQKVLAYQKVLDKIISKIRASLQIDTLCSMTSQEVCRVLGIERLAFYQFHDDWSGNFVNRYGFAVPPWDTMQAFGQNPVWEDTHLQETKGGRYIKNETFAVSDIYTAGHSRCHVDVLEQFQIRAYVLTPIFVGSKLWGLLAAYQHSDTRDWNEREVDFLSKVASHLGVALQQDYLRNEAEEQTTALEDTLTRQRSLTEVVSNIRSSLDTDLLFQTACRDLCKLLKLERAAIYQFADDWSGEFISQFSQVPPQWESSQPFGKNVVWEDTHLQETRGGRYRNNETLAVNDIYEQGYSRCHLDVLEQFKIRAYTLAPIFIGKRLWGLLSAYQHSSTRDWHDYEVDFLSQVAAQLGVAIQQAELLNQSKQRTEVIESAMARQRTLTEVVSKIRSSLDTDLILQTTCQEVCNLLKVERVGVYQFSEDWSGSFVSHFGTTEPQWGTTNPFGKNLLWEDTHLQDTQGGRYRNNETFSVNDVYEAGHTRCHLDILEQFKIRAYAIAPIFVGRTLWGLLAAYQHTTTRNWDEVEVEFLAQVANQLGVAIQSADLFIETQTRAEAQRQSAQQRQILFDVVVKIRESLDLKTIFTTTVQEIRRSLGADRVGVFSFDPDSNFSRGHFVAEDVPPSFPSAMDIPVEDQHFGTKYAAAYAQGDLQVISDVHSAGLADCYVDMLKQFQVQAHIVGPLMNGDRLWGLLCVHQCTRPREWSEADVSFVSQVAAQLSVALQQVVLLTQTQEQAEQLTGTIEDLQKAQLRIIQSEKMASLGQLVAGVAHEIENPISFIQNNIEQAESYISNIAQVLNLYQNAYPTPSTELKETLRRTDPDFLLEDFPKLLLSVKLGTERISDFVDSLRTFSKPDGAAFEEEDIHEGLDSALIILQNRLKASGYSPGIQVLKRYDALPLVSCYPGQMNQVFMNLLSTCIDELEDFDRKRSLEEISKNPSILKVSTAAINDSWITVKIGTNGPGIPETIRCHLFDSGFVTKASGRGSQLGLPISYQIVTEKHSGKLYCTSSSSKGTEFVIEMPIRQTQVTKVMEAVRG